MMFTVLSNLLVPLLIIFVVGYGVHKRVNIYDEFVRGSKEGIQMTISLFPYILGMIVAINLLVKSNALSLIISFFNPLWKLLHIPSAIMPMAIMRPISGSASLVLLNNMLKTYGPDSYLGTLASIFQGGTETTVYVLALYFGSIGIKKIKHALWAGLLTDLMGLLASLFIMYLWFR